MSRMEIAVGKATTVEFVILCLLWEILVALHWLGAANAGRRAKELGKALGMDD